MSIAPIITFKAGRCSNSSSRPIKVKPEAEPGFLYLYSEDDLVHFCWRRRDTSIDDPELDLVMVPTDGTFVPFETDSSQSTTKTNGRIFVLKFGSSSQRHFFWLQSKPQGRTGNPSYFSPRDRKIGDIVNRLLQGEEVNVTRELNNLQNPHNRDDDDDEAMEDVEGQGHAESRPRQGSGGAGPGATGGDVREEGEESREGGSDGARAVSSDADASAAVRNFLNSLQGQQGLSGAGSQQQSDIPYPYLNHLLPTSTTIPMIDAAEPNYVDSLLSYLPPSVLVMAANPSEAVDTKNEPGAAAVENAKASMSLDDKRSLLKKVLRSPQLHQALGTLTMALRDGGLPSIADALGVQVQNGGYIQDGAVPLGGGQAVKAFVEGVEKSVKDQEKK